MEGGNIVESSSSYGGCGDRSRLVVYNLQHVKKTKTSQTEWEEIGMIGRLGSFPAEDLILK